MRLTMRMISSIKARSCIPDSRAIASQVWISRANFHIGPWTRDWSSRKDANTKDNEVSPSVSKKDSSVFSWGNSSSSSTLDPRQQEKGFDLVLKALGLQRSTLEAQLLSYSVNGLTLNQWKSSFKHLVPGAQLPDVNFSHFLAVSLLTLEDSILTPNVDVPSIYNAVQDASHEKILPLSLRKSVFKDAIYYGKLAQMAYSESLTEIARSSYIKQEKIIGVKLRPEFDAAQQAFSPAFFLAADDEKRAVSLVIRGTKHVEDAIIDICGEPQPFLSEKYPNQFFAHGGLNFASIALYGTVRDGILKLLHENPDYHLCFVGHSLGAGTAALVSILAKEDPALQSVKQRVFLYNSPPVVSKTLAAKTLDDPEFYCFVNANDVVSRVSVRSIRVALNALQTYYDRVDVRTLWEQALALRDSSSKPRLAENTVVSSSKSSAYETQRREREARKSQTLFLEILEKENEANGMDEKQLYLAGKVIHLQKPTESKMAHYAPIVTTPFDSHLGILPVSKSMLSDHILRAMLPNILEVYKYL